MTDAHVIDRPERGNMLRRQTALELAAALRDLRDDPAQRVAILTGAGDSFFCIGGEHEDADTLDHSAALPIVDVYELIDTVAKPVIAAVNGFAVGGGNVLQVVCDLTIAAESAVFRQVGPIVGSFDAGYGTWYLEETIGRKRAKEMWYLNRKYSARARRWRWASSTRSSPTPRCCRAPARSPRSCSTAGRRRWPA